jgi:hypothetical protein
MSDFFSLKINDVQNLISKNFMFVVFTIAFYALFYNLFTNSTSVVDDTCPVGEEKCNNICVDTQTNINHCGSCNTNPLNASSCNNGVYECTTGFSKCGGDTCNFNLLDATNSVVGGTRFCGDCQSEFLVSDKKICNNGQLQCPGDFIQCPGSSDCVNLRTDLNNCGQCGIGMTPGLANYCINGTPGNNCSNNQSQTEMSSRQYCNSTKLILRGNVDSPLSGFFDNFICIEMRTVTSCGTYLGDTDGCTNENCEVGFPGPAQQPACCPRNYNPNFVVGNYHECADLNSSTKHCGACNTGCSGNQPYCVDGQCSSTP